MATAPGHWSSKVNFVLAMHEYFGLEFFGLSRRHGSIAVMHVSPGMARRLGCTADSAIVFFIENDADSILEKSLQVPLHYRVVKCLLRQCLHQSSECVYE